jgi:hypothetical protein
MILISHRGNVNGKSENIENEPSFIETALSKGFDVEIDIRIIEGSLYLGHDVAQYKVEKNWVIERRSKLWIHCKNIDSLSFFKEIDMDINYFWHQEDDVTITSKGYFWTYPGKQLTKNSIAVMPETKPFENIQISLGICSDFIEKFKI